LAKKGKGTREGRELGGLEEKNSQAKDLTTDEKRILGGNNSGKKTLMRLASPSPKRSINASVNGGGEKRGQIGRTGDKGKTPEEEFRKREVWT